MGHGALRAEVRRPHIHVEQLVVLGLGERERVARLCHARVVHEHVEATELRGGFVDDATAVGDLRQVAAQDGGAAAGRGDLHAGLARAVGAMRVVDRDRRALPRELTRDALADTRSAAGDERATTLQCTGGRGGGGPSIVHTRSSTRPRRCQRSPKRLR